MRQATGSRERTGCELGVERLLRRPLRPGVAVAPQKARVGTVQNLISPQLLGRHLDPSFYGPIMAPYFAVHVKYAERSSAPWVWASERAVNECLASTWDMLGKWQARRAVKVDQPAFAAGVPGAVARLATVLNRHGVRSLRDVGDLSTLRYRTVMRAIQDAVVDISRIKKTRTAEPMFGSKVLHHYFPSVVPVFDTAMVRKRAMQVQAFGEFLEEKGRDWLVWHDAGEACGASALEFHQFTAFCAAQVTEAPVRLLKQTRKAMATALVDFAPGRLADDGDSFLWRLDAKVAEFCALGQAVVRGSPGLARP
jgi:hypothetical protein